jgi:hypothetical protein
MNFEILHAFPPAKTEQSWREFLQRVDLPSHYNAPEYFLDPLRSGSRAFAILALDDDLVRGVLSGFHLGKEVFSGLASRPQICIDGADSDAALSALAAGVLEESAGAALVHVFTWSSLELPGFSALGFRHRQLKGCVVLDLTRGEEALFRDFAKDRRRNIRFAEKHGVEVRESASSQDVRDAYAVYSAWRKTDRKEVKSDWTFSDFEKTMRVRSNRRLFLATFEGKVIAFNIFRFFPDGLFESAANSSLEQFMHLKPNDLLQWRGIQWACSQGMRRHSLGGAHDFLLRFGGTVAPILHYRLDKTLFHRHDLKDGISGRARSLLQQAPAPVGQALKRLLKKRG